MQIDISTEWHDLGREFAAAGLRRAPCAPEAFSVGFDSYKGAPRQCDYFGRKALSLRLSALQRGMRVDFAVSPEVPKEITGRQCLVSRVSFKYGAATDAAPSVDRWSVFPA